MIPVSSVFRQSFISPAWEGGDWPDLTQKTSVAVLKTSRKRQIYNLFEKKCKIFIDFQLFTKVSVKNELQKMKIFT